MNLGNVKWWDQDDMRTRQRFYKRQQNWQTYQRVTSVLGQGRRLNVRRAILSLGLQGSWCHFIISSECSQIPPSLKGKGAVNVTFLLVTVKEKWIHTVWDFSGKVFWMSRYWLCFLFSVLYTVFSIYRKMPRLVHFNAYHSDLHYIL